MTDADDETFCSGCGHLLVWREVACRVDGEYIDFEGRKAGEISLVFCSECWSKIDAIHEGGVARARKQWRELHLMEDV